MAGRAPRDDRAPRRPLFRPACARLRARRAIPGAGRILWGGARETDRFGVRKFDRPFDFVRLD